MFACPSEIAIAMSREGTSPIPIRKVPMKKFALACLLALPVLAASQQTASAHGRLFLGFNFCLQIDCDGCNAGCGAAGCGNCGGYGCGYGGPAWGGSPAWGGHAGAVPGGYAGGHPIEAGPGTIPPVAPAPGAIKPTGQPVQGGAAYPGYMPVGYYGNPGYSLYGR